MTRKTCRTGFTLIELLVVIAIIALLMAMLLPAIQRVREAANKAVCANHLRTIGQAVALYQRSHGEYFPTGGGDDYIWQGKDLPLIPMPRSLTAAGVPSTRLNQDWGWLFQILPYLEQESLWTLRRAGTLPFYSSPGGRDIIADDEIRKTTVSTYFCPTRRVPQVIEGPESGYRGMNDYAGNMGAFSFIVEGGVFHSPCTNADDPSNSKERPFRNGIFIKSRYWKADNYNSTSIDRLIHTRDVKDGMNYTLLASEKVVKLNFTGKPQFGDVNGFVAGYIADTLRTGGKAPSRDYIDSNPDYGTDRFGSAHPTSINALFCDGSVRQISYSMSEDRQICNVYNDMLDDVFKIPADAALPPGYMYLTLMQRLCHRVDGGTVDMTRLLD